MEIKAAAAQVLTMNGAQASGGAQVSAVLVITMEESYLLIHSFNKIFTELPVCARYVLGKLLGYSDKCN